MGSGLFVNAYHTGYFAETDRQEVQIASPYADGKGRSLATSIFYLLTADHPSGKIHMNKSIVRRFDIHLLLGFLTRFEDNACAPHWSCGVHPHYAVLGEGGLTNDQARCNGAKCISW